MSESPEASGKPKVKGLGWVIGGVALVGVAAAVYIIGSASTKPAPPAPSASATASTFASKLTTPTTPTPSPDYTFYDGDGKAMKIADLKGKVVVMNIWATWCAPCVTEMPTLAKLQAVYATQPVTVLPISVDRDGDLNLVNEEMAANPPLKSYRDPGYKLSFAMDPKAAGYPTTVIYDRQGRERARMSGPADWASPEARGIVEKLLAEK